MSHHTQLRLLTARQEADARSEAYDAFAREYGNRFPEMEPDTADLVHTNERVKKMLIGGIGIMPVFLILITISAMVVSADRTFHAFSQTAANEGVLGIWPLVIGFLGVTLTEGSMIYVSFAATRERLQMGLHRTLVTLPSILRGIKVRLGLAPVPDWDEIPDTSLQSFSKMVFVLVLAANIFTTTAPLLKDGTAGMQVYDQIVLGFAVFMGAIAPFALHNVGSQLAKQSHDLYVQRKEEIKRELMQSYRAEMDRRWAMVEDELSRRALHRKFITVNRLDLDAESPYLLLSGNPDTEGQSVSAIPLPSSWTALPTPSQTDLPSSPNGSQERT